MILPTKPLIAALSSLPPLCNKRTTLPILSCVRLEAVKGSLSLVASDLDCEIHRPVPCDGDLPPLCVNGKQFADIVAYAGESVDLTVKGNRLLIAGRGNASLSVQPAVEFPPFMQTGKAQGVPVKDLAEGIRFASNFASHDPSRFVLNSVHIMATAKMLTVQSTNGYILGRMARPLMCAQFEALFCDRHAKSIADELEVEGATLSLGDKCLSVSSPAGLLAVRLKEGRFPNTDPIVNTERPLAGTISREALLEAVHACDSITTALQDKIHLSWDKDGFNVQFKTAENECRRHIAGQFVAGEMFASSGNLLKILTAFSGDALSLAVREHESMAFSSGDMVAIVAGMRA